MIERLKFRGKVKSDWRINHTVYKAGSWYVADSPSRLGDFFTQLARVEPKIDPATVGQWTTAKTFTKKHTDIYDGDKLNDPSWSVEDAVTVVWWEPNCCWGVKHKNGDIDDLFLWLCECGSQAEVIGNIHEVQP